MSPDLAAPTAAPRPLLQVRGLSKHFPIAGSTKVVQACSDVSFEVRPGETVGVVGESGSGKTTLGRCVLRLLEPTSGSVQFDGQDTVGLRGSALRALRSRMQIVFQEPLDSFNPRLPVGRQIADPLRIHSTMDGAARRRRVLELLDLVGLPHSVANAYPAALSGGTAQRCSIARAIATDPTLIVLDEPTSALAPEAEVEVIGVLRRLQRDLGMSYIFISHNLSLVGEFCDRIVVMYLSQVVEVGQTSAVFGTPHHPYTRSLLAATLRVDHSQRTDRSQRWERLGGEIPSPVDLPAGCYLAGRCLYARPRCHSEAQSLQRDHSGREVRCWRAAEGDLTPTEIEETRQRATLEARRQAAAIAEAIDAGALQSSSASPQEEQHASSDRG